ncbi:MAG: hypothetical protein ACREID_09570 [Planctomycetota bacterium]
MDPWLAKAVVLLGTIGIVAIRAPHGRRSLSAEVVKGRKGRIEIALLRLAWVGFFVPLVWVATPPLALADHPLRPLPFFAGVPALAAGLWLLHRPHRDRATHGVYRRVRHPMYTALLRYSMGQALAVPNGLAGPSYGVAFALPFAFRVGPEERMMLAEFGEGYAAYMARTKRLVPGVW